MNSKIPLSQALAETTTELKHTAKACGIPIVLLCQLNRSSASEKRAPEMHDLRDSGAIEQDADIILMLERASEDEDGKEINIWVRKNRGGKAGNVKIEVVANDTYTVFTEKADEYINVTLPERHINPIEAIQEEIHRLTRSPFEEPDEFNNQFPF
jgi:replicative DNA helicase